MGLSLNYAEIHAESCERLADAVVQVASQSSAFLILHTLETRRELYLLLL